MAPTQQHHPRNSNLVPVQTVFNDSGRIILWKSVQENLNSAHLGLLKVCWICCYFSGSYINKSPDAEVATLEFY